MDNKKSVKAIIKFLICFIIVCFFKTTHAQTNNAFGDNQKLIDSTLVGPNYVYIFAIYSGDINRDGAVDALDYVDLDPSIQAGDGGYVSGDLNGDGAVDALDYLVMDPNIQNGVGTTSPP